MFCHPTNTKSLCYSLLKKIEQTLQNNKTEFKTIDLYKENFDCVLDSKDFIAMNSQTVLKDVDYYQKLIKEYKNIIFIFPLWWVGMPALLKGWVDRVFSFNFAYATDSNGDIIGLLDGITSEFIITMGSKIADYHKNKLYDAVVNAFNTGIMEFCNVKNEKWFFFGDVLNANKDIIDSWFKEIETYYK